MPKGLLGDVRGRCSSPISAAGAAGPVTVEPLRSVASEGIRVWMFLRTSADVYSLVSSGVAALSCVRLRYFKWFLGLNVGTSSSSDRWRRPRLCLEACRLRTAALPSARISSASGVEHPNASTSGTELLLFLCVLGRGPSALGEGEECLFSMFGSCGSLDS